MVGGELCQQLSSPEGWTRSSKHPHPIRFFITTHWGLKRHCCGKSCPPTYASKVIPGGHYVPYRHDLVGPTAAVDFPCLDGKPKSLGEKANQDLGAVVNAASVALACTRSAGLCGRWGKRDKAGQCSSRILVSKTVDRVAFWRQAEHGHDGQQRQAMQGDAPPRSAPCVRRNDHLAHPKHAISQKTTQQCTDAAPSSAQWNRAAH